MIGHVANNSQSDVCSGLIVLCPAAMKTKSSPTPHHLALHPDTMSPTDATEPVSTVDFTTRRSPSPLSHRPSHTQDPPVEATSGSTSPYPMRKSSEDPYVGTPDPYAPPDPYAYTGPLDPYGSGSSSAQYSSGSLSPTVFTPLTLTLEEKRKMMSRAAKEESVAEDPLAKLGFKPREGSGSVPGTPGSPFGFGIGIPPASTVNRRDSNATKVPMTESTGYWLALYFVFNLGLTLYNKVVLVNFPFPYVSPPPHAFRTGYAADSLTCRL